MKNLTAYLAGIATVPVVIYLGRVPLTKGLVHILSHKDMDRSWNDLVEAREGMAKTRDEVEA